MERAIYFYEPRLRMTVGGRFIVRLITYCVYAILIVGAITMLLSDLRELRAIGVLLGLFLADRALGVKKARRSLARLPASASNAADYFTPHTYRIMERALDRASLHGSDLALECFKLLLGRRDIQLALVRMDIRADEVAARLEKALTEAPGKRMNREALDQTVRALGIAAFEASRAAASAHVEPKDLFVALGKLPHEGIERIMKVYEVNPEDLIHALVYANLKRRFFLRLKRMPATLTGFVGKPFRVRHRVMNRAWTARPTPFLDSFAQDLTDLARMERVGFLVGHEKEYDRMTDILSRPGKPNVLLVGDPGSGKSTLVAHLAYEITRDRVPPQLFDRRLVSLDIGALVSGAQEGQLQERVRRVLGEIVAAGNVILYLPDVHNLVKTSGALRLAAADILLPAIKSDAFSVIGDTSPRAFKELIEPQGDFASAFETVKVEELSETEALRFLVYESVVLEEQYRMVIAFSALREAVTLAHKHFRDKLLPSSASDLLKEALSDAAAKKKKSVTREDIIATAERKTNVPIHKATQEEAAQLLNLEQLIHERLIDQGEAVAAVSRALREYRSGLSRKGGPIATFLFVGPTGVGKTELSKILTRIQFGDETYMVRVDMSEYQNKENIYQLIGSPKGEVGGSLTDAILAKPYSLILLDEFEKAHPDILNLFLQVFDDGRLTDNLGRTVDFTNTIIIATSNAHSEFIKASLEEGRPMSAIAEELKKKLVDYFKPELLNRFSGIICFRALSPEHILAIARLNLKELAKTAAESNGIALSFDETAIRKIAELGYDPAFGARPLRGVISERIKSQLAEKILKGEIGRGANAKVAYEEGEFRFIV